jgi:hypothetical protein
MWAMGWEKTKKKKKKESLELLAGVHACPIALTT